MMKHLLTSLVCASALGLPQPVIHGRQEEIDTVERTYIASRIYAAMHKYFGHWQALSEPDIEIAYRAYLASIRSSQSRKDFDLQTRKFVACFKNGHTQFGDQWLRQNFGQPIPFGLDQIGKDWVVTSTRIPALKLGDIVRAVDGKEISDFVGDLAVYVSASNERIARSHVFSFPELFSRSFTLALDSGRRVVITRGPDAASAQSVPPKSETRWIVRDRVGYIKIPSFGDQNYEQSALDFVHQAERAEALIVDLRGNGGGSSPWRLIEALMNKPWRSWNEVTPQTIPLYEAQGSPKSSLSRTSRQIPAAPNAFAGRLYVLVDRYTGSAAEDMVMPIKDSHRGTIIGELTQGSSGQPYRLDLGQGMGLFIGTVRYSFPDGSPFEGVGIAPDEVQGTTVEDIVQGKDPVLARAIALASRSK